MEVAHLGDVGLLVSVVMGIDLLRDLLLVRPLGHGLEEREGGGV